MRDPEEDFFELCELFVDVSNKLNKYEISPIGRNNYEMESHEHAFYSLHLRHVLEFAEAIMKALNGLNPHKLPQDATISAPTTDHVKHESIPLPPNQSSQKLLSTPSQQTRSPAPAQKPLISASLSEQRSSQQPLSLIPTPEDLMSQKTATTPIPDCVYISGSEYIATCEMDINVKVNDKIKLVTYMENGMGLGANLETGAVGTFAMSCITTGNVLVEDKVATVPARTSIPAQPTERDFDARQDRFIGRHIAISKYQSSSVLEVSLEPGDEIEVMFWEDAESAVGIHIRTQTESLFRKSFIRYVGNGEGNKLSLRGMESQGGPSQLPVIPPVRITARRDSLPHDPAQMQQQYQQRLSRASDRLSSGYENDSQHGNRRSILAQVVAFQQDDANKYKHYLEHLDNPTSNMPTFQKQNSYSELLDSYPDAVPPPRSASASRQGTWANPNVTTTPISPMPKMMAGAKHVISELHMTEESYMRLLTVFQQIEREEWAVYEEYIKNYQPAQQIISNMQNRRDIQGEQFLQFLNRLDVDPCFERRSLQDFMMLPIQRITRYWLLLERLRGYVERESVVYESLTVAEGYMKEIANTLQTIQTKEEQQRKMFEIINLIENCPASLLSFSQRQYIAEFPCYDTVGTHLGLGLADLSGVIQSLLGMSTSMYGPGSRTIYMFSDCILVAANRSKSKNAQNGKKMELVQKLDIKDIVLDSSTEAEDPESVQLKIKIRPENQSEFFLTFKMPDTISRKTAERHLRQLIKSK
ncbi:hypothetical protein HDV05_000152 [Chytridiales sp. JEL 0842]|nr:hypothetical protein HDV05_000152 [Chytridiales sp. JEL 0842]